MHLIEVDWHVGKPGQHQDHTIWKSCCTENKSCPLRCNSVSVLPSFRLFGCNVAPYSNLYGYSNWIISFPLTACIPTLHPLVLILSRYFLVIDKKLFRFKLYFLLLKRIFFVCMTGIFLLLIRNSFVLSYSYFLLLKRVYTNKSTFLAKSESKLWHFNWFLS